MGTKTLDQCIQRQAMSGVDYICASPNTPNAPEILESHAMKAALATFSERYDLVILDSPPVMAVSDARIISQLVSTFPRTATTSALISKIFPMYSLTLDGLDKAVKKLVVKR